MTGRPRIIPQAAELIEIVRAEPTITAQQLAAKFGVTRAPVVTACTKAGLALACNRRPIAILNGEPIVPPIRLPSTVDEIAHEVRKLYIADPSLTAVDVMERFSVSSSTAYRAIKASGVSLRNPKRVLPDDTELAAELRQDGTKAVARKYGISPDRVSRHSVRLGIEHKGQQKRKLPPDDILVDELAVLSNSEIVKRYSCSFEVVRKARKRLTGAIKPRVSYGPSVAAVPLLSTAIGHLHSYRGILAAIDPTKATALLADIDELTTVASAITTIAGLVAAPRSAS